MTDNSKDETPLWLGHFRDPEPIWSQGWRGLYSAKSAEGEPRLVLTAPPGTDATGAKHWLDNVAEVYSRFDCPGLPKTALRTSVGDIELVAFECDAVGDMSYISGLADYKMPYPAWFAVAHDAIVPLQALHSTIDPATGRGHVTGRWSLCNVLYGPSGLWLFNYGLGESAALTGTNVEAVVALSVAAGMPARVHDDLQALVDVMLKTLAKLDGLPQRMGGLLSGQSGGEKREVVAAFSSGMSRIRGGGAPFESTDEIWALFETVHRALGVTYDPAALPGVVETLVARRSQAPPTATHTPNLEGTVSAEAPTTWSMGRYQIEHKLGQGGMGTAYLARDRQLGQRVVLKVMRERNDSSMARFVREVRIIRKLSHHPNIVSGYDLITENGFAAAVMELIKGPTFGVWRRRNKDDPDYVVSVLTFGSQIASALALVHAAGVVHRDVKPSNILIEPDRGAVLVDFGVAAAADGESLTASGIAIGTLRYMAPEQTMGDSPPAVDVYGLGRVLSEALAEYHISDEVAQLLADAQNMKAAERPAAKAFSEALAAAVVAAE